MSLPRPYIDLIKKVCTDYPNVVICGSAGLVLNGFLSREVHDLDIITFKNHQSMGGFYDKLRQELGIKKAESHMFMVGFDQVLGFKLVMNDINIDILYNKNKPPEFDVMDIEGVAVRVENPHTAIDVKLLYIQGDRQESRRLKHIKDLLDMCIINKVISEALEIAIEELDRGKEEYPRDVLPTHDGWPNEDDLPF